MLTRIYGISFPKKSMLDEYLKMMEEAKKRDHRKLGKDLELFCFSQRVGQGLPLWLPKGAALRDRLEQFLRNVQKEYGYQQVITPHIGNKELYVTSGHYAKYGKDSFQPIHTPIEGEEYLLKPMNCPHHCEIYRSKPRSYKELPVRLAEFGTVYRYEQSGELHGLDPCARLHAGRRPHVRTPRPTARRVRKSDRHRALYFQDAQVRQLYGTDFAARSQQQGEVHRLGRELGEGRVRRSSEAAAEKGLQTAVGVRRGRLLRAEAGLHGKATPSAASGSWERSRWTTTCPKRFDLTSSRAPTTSCTARS